jgi:pimeloyl-ACP methyl ester carboxylesterase
VDTPTLVVWGRRDPALSVRLADPGPLVPRRRIVVLPTAGHFVHRDEPQRVSALIGEFAGGGQR